MYCCYAVTSKETEPTTNVFIRCDGAVFWRDFHNHLFFRPEIQIPHLLENSKSVNCIEVVVPLHTAAKYKCLHQMWQCTVGDFWHKAKLSPLDTIFWTNLGWGRCTLGDYWRFGSRLIDMTQCLHSGIPTLMTTSIWRDFSHLTPVWT